MNDELRIANDEYQEGFFHSSFVIRHSSFLALTKFLSHFLLRKMS